MKNREILSEKLKEIFKDCYDFEMRELWLGAGHKKVRICFIDGLVSGDSVGDSVIEPLTNWVRMISLEADELTAGAIAFGGAAAYTVKERTALNDIVGDLLKGYTALLLDESHRAVTFETKSSEKRSVQEPTEEKVMKGAKDGFIESIKSNTALVRKKLRNRDLKFKEVVLGQKTNTTAVIAYLDGYTSPALIQEMIGRLERATMAGPLAAGWVEDSLQDAPGSIFPQLITTERADRFCMNLLEGRVGLLIDGFPVGYLAPGTFSQFFKAPEDLSASPFWGTFMVLLRYAAFFLAIFLPAFYVAVVMYHQEMLPTKLLLSIVEAKQQVPFSSGGEVLLMLLSFELLQEAGLRLPNSIGQTVSIVGALIVGQSAVEAKVLSPVVVIVVAMAGIAGYVMPNQEMGTAVRILRFVMVVGAALLGMLGVAMGAVLLINVLCRMDCFGVAYLTPVADSLGLRRKKAFGVETRGEKDLREQTLREGNRNP